MRPHVSMDVHQVDFGQCSDLNSVEQQSVNVTNHTNGKVTVVWMGGELVMSEILINYQALLYDVL